MSLDNITPWMPNASRELSGDLHEWLRSVGEWFDSGERYGYAVALKDGTLVGHVTVRPEADGTVVFGYWAHSRHLRRGYISEAVGELLPRFAPATFVIHCSPENPASRGVAAKLGFVHIGMESNGEMRWELVVTAD